MRVPLGLLKEQVVELNRGKSFCGVGLFTQQMTKAVLSTAVTSIFLMPTGFLVGTNGINVVRVTEHRFTVSAFNVVHHVNNKTFKVFCHPSGGPRVKSSFTWQRRQADGGAYLSPRGVAPRSSSRAVSDRPAAAASKV